MRLGDIIINNDIEREGINKILAFFSNDPTDYRNKGLGTQLLQLVIDCAKSQGVKTLDGSIVQSDIDANGHLRDWYQKHGFQVEFPTSEQKNKGAIYRICLYFNN